MPIGKQPPDDAPTPAQARHRDSPPPQDVFRVVDKEGRPVPDTGSGAGPGFLTQNQWDLRDKSAGWVRVDERGRPLADQEQTDRTRGTDEHAERPPAPAAPPLAPE